MNPPDPPAERLRRWANTLTADDRPQNRVACETELGPEGLRRVLAMVAAGKSDVRIVHRPDLSAIPRVDVTPRVDLTRHRLHHLPPTARAGLGRRTSQGGRRTTAAAAAGASKDDGGPEPPEGPPPAEAHGRGDEQDSAPNYLIPPAPTPEIVEQADPDVAVAMYCALWKGTVDLEDLVAHLAGQVLTLAQALQRSIEREAERERRRQR